MFQKAINRASWERRSSQAAFTLIELILVMMILIVILAMTGPSLSRFFRGRTLESETRRFISLTHYARSRAISEGIPMLVWIDPQQQRYGLEAEISFTGRDDKAVDYDLDQDVQFEVEQPALTAQGGMQSAQASRFGRSSSIIRFQPDGFITETSPRNLWLRQVGPESGDNNQRDGDAFWITQSTNRLRYEVGTNDSPYALK